MKTWFTIAGILIIAGSLIFTLSACNGGLNFDKNLEEKTVNVTDSFEGVDICTSTANISILPSDDGSCKIVSKDIKKIKYTANIENGILKIKTEDTRKWFERISFVNSSALTVYLPLGEYTSLSIDESTGNIAISEGYKFGNVDIKLSTGNVDLKNIICADFSLKLSTGDTCINGITCKSFTSTGSTGDITVNNITATGNTSVKRSTGNININTANLGGNLSTETDTGNNNAKNVTCLGNFELEVSTGRSELSNITCANFSSEGDTGNLIMNNVIATGKFSIERDTGDVKFNGCDAAEIYVETDTGNVTGTLLSDKIFQTNTDTGSVNVPESWSGGKCKIETDTGNIKISIQQ